MVAALMVAAASATPALAQCDMSGEWSARSAEDGGDQLTVVQCTEDIYPEYLKTIMDE